MINSHVLYRLSYHGIDLTASSLLPIGLAVNTLLLLGIGLASLVYLNYTVCQRNSRWIGLIVETNALGNHMPIAPLVYLQSPDMDELILSKVRGEFQEAAFRVRNWLVSVDEKGNGYLNHYGVPRAPRFTSMDMCLYMMVIEELAEVTTADLLAEMFSTTPLSAKTWIKRLRIECACRIDLDDRCYVVNSWGIFNRAVYVAFQPYVKLVVSNWLSDHPHHLDETTRVAQRARSRGVSKVRVPAKSDKPHGKPGNRSDS